MRTIHPDLLGDLGDQMLDFDRRLGIRRLEDDPLAGAERKIAATLNTPAQLILSRSCCYPFPNEDLASHAALSGAHCLDRRGDFLPSCGCRCLYGFKIGHAHCGNNRG